MDKEESPTWADWLTHKAVAAFTLILIFSDNWGESYLEGGFSHRTIQRVGLRCFWVALFIYVPVIYITTVLLLLGYAVYHRASIRDYIRMRNE
jgi:hypothetical protein